MRVYLDHNATSPLRDEVIEAMSRILRDVYGNPSSVHEEGRAARSEMDAARESVAELLGVGPDAVLFTGGATEANNTALLGVLRHRNGAPGTLVTTSVEHPSVEAPLVLLEREGWRVERIGVDRDGLVDEAAYDDALRLEPALVSVIWANNETGVLQPVARLAERARARGALVHVDATQAVGKIAIDMASAPIDLLSLTAHKFNGPKGVGALISRDTVAFESILSGGPQERRRRGGTENLAGIGGLGVACELATRELPERTARYAALRDRLWAGIEAKIARVHRNGSSEHVLPNTLNLEFEGAAGELLLQALDVEGVAVSSGAACHSGSVEPSAVLVAMGRSIDQARGSLRLSVGHGNDEAQIDYVLSLLPDLVERSRAAMTA